MSEATRNQLIEKGRQAFADLGFAGARVDRIAREAGVNKALINYHFRGKGGLYQSILGDVLQQTGEDLEATLASEDDPTARLLLWPRALWDALESTPDFAPLFLRELASGCTAMPTVGMEATGNSFSLLAQILSVGRKRGQIERVEPFPLGLLLLGTLLVAQISAPLRQGLERTLRRDQLAGTRGAVVPLLQKLIERGLLSDSARKP